MSKTAVQAWFFGALTLVASTVGSTAPEGDGLDAFCQQWVKESMALLTVNKFDTIESKKWALDYVCSAESRAKNANVAWGGTIPIPDLGIPAQSNASGAYGSSSQRSMCDYKNNVEYLSVEYGKLLEPVLKAVPEIARACVESLTKTDERGVFVWGENLDNEHLVLQVRYRSPGPTCLASAPVTLEMEDGHLDCHWPEGTKFSTKSNSPVGEGKGTKGATMLVPDEVTIPVQCSRKDPKIPTYVTIRSNGIDVKPGNILTLKPLLAPAPVAFCPPSTSLTKKEAPLGILVAFPELPLDCNAVVQARPRASCTSETNDNVKRSRSQTIYRYSYPKNRHQDHKQSFDGTLPVCGGVALIDQPEEATKVWSIWYDNDNSGWCETLIIPKGTQAWFRAGRVDGAYSDASEISEACQEGNKGFDFRIIAPPANILAPGVAD